MIIQQNKHVSVSKIRMCKIQYKRNQLVSLKNEENSGYQSQHLLSDSTPEEILKGQYQQRKKIPRGKGNKYQLLSIINWNIEGLNNAVQNSPSTNFDLFQNSDIILLTETLCTETPLTLTGYYNTSIPAEKPEDGRGRPFGGITIYSKPFVNLEVIKSSNNKIHCSTSFGEVLCYYFNPITDISDIVQELTEDILTIKSDTCIIVGDFNCRTDKPNQKGESLLNLLHSKQFRLINNPTEPTYICHNGQSCIDLTFVKSKKYKVLKECQILKDPLKKHQRVKATIRVKFNSKRIQHPLHKEKISRKTNLHKIKKNPLTSQLSPEAPDDIKNLTKILTQAAKKKSTSQKRHKEWFDEECKLLKERNIELMKEDFSIALRTEAQKEYKTLIRNKRISYEENKLLEKCKNAQLKPWEMFEKNFGSPSIKLSLLEIHFKNLLQVPIENSENENESVLSTSSNEWYDQEISLLEIQRAMKSLKNKKSAGLDGVFNEHLKETFEYFQDWWLIYMNSILNKGTISEIWRIGKLKTLYKGKGNVNDPNMYRGISLMSVTYKLYTKILNNRILNNIDNLLPNEQFGFRRGRNCESAIEILRSKIREHLSLPRGNMYAVFVDFQKAFDSLDRKLLLQTLQQTNIKGKIYNSIKNIISSNFIQIDNGVETSNNAIQQNIGVIQGDPLSSTLFLIYVKSLPETLNSPFVYTLMYADDLVIFSISLTLLQEALNKLSSWCSTHKLQVNQSKTKVMKFRKGGKLSTKDNLLFNNIPLDFVNEYEYLGVKMQPTLCISNHIENKAIKASYAIGTIKNMQNLSLDTIHKIYYLKIWPIMTYSFNILAKDLTCQHLFELDKVKSKFYKKALGVHKNTSNTLVLHMAETERMGQEVIKKFGIKEEHIEEYLKKVEEKNMIFVNGNYTDGPIFRTNIWKKHGQSNRHIISRFTVHGFHHLICNNKSYHINFETCKCMLCNENITDRYHMNQHIKSSSTNLTNFITDLERN